MTELSFRAWLAWCIEQARFNHDALDPKAAEILTNVLEQYDARHRTEAEQRGIRMGIEAAAALCDQWANHADREAVLVIADAIRTLDPATTARESTT